MRGRKRGPKHEGRKQRTTASWNGANGRAFLPFAFTLACYRRPMAKSAAAPAHPVLNRLLFGLALLGVLVVIHLWIQQGRGFDQGCWGFNPGDAASAAVFDCAVVTESEAGTLFGLSNVVWGLGFYLAVAALSAALAFAPPERRRPLRLGRAVLIGGGFLYAMVLVYEQFFSIGELCALCLTSAGITTALFALQVLDLVRARSRTREAASRAQPAYYAVLAGVLLLLVGADLVYFSSLDGVVEETAEAAAEAQAAPASQPAAALAAAVRARDECGYSLEVPPVENPEALVSFQDPVKGNPGAPVTVVEYFDPNCPHCKTMHGILEQVAAEHGDEARFYYVPFVLWPNPDHPNYSLEQAEALLAAAQEGKFFEMLERQFERQDGAMPLEEIQEIAREVGMDVDKMTAQLRNDIFTPVLLDRRREIAARGIRSTPTVLINGRVVATKTAECLAQLIEEEAAEGGETAG